MAYILGVNNVVNLIVEDQVMWLVDIQAQLISNLEEAQRRYKENVDEHCKDQPNFKVGDQVWL
jgi:exosome complex RNA-binding protein Rrp4